MGLFSGKGWLACFNPTPSGASSTAVGHSNMLWTQHTMGSDDSDEGILPPPSQLTTTDLHPSTPAATCAAQPSERSFAVTETASQHITVADGLAKPPTTGEEQSTAPEPILNTWWTPYSGGCHTLVSNSRGLDKRLMQRQEQLKHYSTPSTSPSALHRHHKQQAKFAVDMKSDVFDPPPSRIQMLKSTATLAANITRDAAQPRQRVLPSELSAPNTSTTVTTATVTTSFNADGTQDMLMGAITSGHLIPEITPISPRNAGPSPPLDTVLAPTSHLGSSLTAWLQNQPLPSRVEDATCLVLQHPSRFHHKVSLHSTSSSAPDQTMALTTADDLRHTPELRTSLSGASFRSTNSVGRGGKVVSRLDSVTAVVLRDRTSSNVHSRRRSFEPVTLPLV